MFNEKKEASILKQAFKEFFTFVRRAFKVFPLPAIILDANIIRDSIIMPSVIWDGLVKFSSPVSNIFESAVSKVANILPAAIQDKIFLRNIVKTSAPLITAIAAVKVIKAFTTNWDEKLGLFTRGKRATYAAGETLVESGAAAIGASVATAVVGGFVAPVIGTIFAAKVAKGTLGFFTDKVLEKMKPKLKPKSIFNNNANNTQEDWERNPAYQEQNEWANLANFQAQQNNFQQR